MNRLHVAFRISAVAVIEIKKVCQPHHLTAAQGKDIEVSSRGPKAMKAELLRTSMKRAEPIQPNPPAGYRRLKVKERRRHLGDPLILSGQLFRETAENVP